jgi:hypothetical protein
MPDESWLYNVQGPLLYLILLGGGEPQMLFILALTYSVVSFNSSDHIELQISRISTAVLPLIN